MQKIERFRLTELTLEGFKCFSEPTTLTFGAQTAITGGNGRGKTSIADAIAFAVTGVPFFGERGIDRLHSEMQPILRVALRFVDEHGAPHELIRSRQKSRMTVLLDGREVRQHDLNELFGERDVFLSIFNPLYFIEELGESGKQLLERYLPNVTQETVLAALPESVQNSLRGKSLLSPDVFLKNLRAEVRSLEEQLVYLNGQKDLSESQTRERAASEQELTERLNNLHAEIAALEAKQFDGLDTATMQERLAMLNERYEEAMRDHAAADEQQRSIVQMLREKIARRETEIYQSPYDKEIAVSESRLAALREQYKREQRTCSALTAGTACPTCHRPITAASLPEVHQAFRSLADKVLTEGKAQRAQIDELRELERKARETFEQFRADDLARWSAEAEAVSRTVETENIHALHTELQALTAQLDYGNLSHAEYERLHACRDELRETEAALNALRSVTPADCVQIEQQIAEVQHKITESKALMNDVLRYTGKLAELTFAPLQTNRVSISLCEVVKSTGECKDVFKFTYAGRRYDRLSLSEKVRAGMEVSELMQRLTGRCYPVYVDNMESIDDLANAHPTGQLLLAKCVRGTPLRVQAVGQSSTSLPKAA